MLYSAVKTLALAVLVLYRGLSSGINELMLATDPVFLHGSDILLIVDQELASMAITTTLPCIDVHIVLCGL
jgi:hypothetical protein